MRRCSDLDNSVLLVRHLSLSPINRHLNNKFKSAINRFSITLIMNGTIDLRHGSRHLRNHIAITLCANATVYSLNLFVVI